MPWGWTHSKGKVWQAVTLPIQKGSWLRYLEWNLSVLSLFSSDFLTRLYSFTIEDSLSVPAQQRRSNNPESYVSRLDVCIHVTALINMAREPEGGRSNKKKCNQYFRRRCKNRLTVERCGGAESSDVLFISLFFPGGGGASKGLWLSFDFCGAPLTVPKQQPPEIHPRKARYPLSNNRVGKNAICSVPDAIYLRCRTVLDDETSIVWEEQVITYS